MIPTLTVRLDYYRQHFVGQYSVAASMSYGHNVTSWSIDRCCCCSCERIVRLLNIATIVKKTLWCWTHTAQVSLIQRAAVMVPC